MSWACIKPTLPMAWLDKTDARIELRKSLQVQITYQLTKLVTLLTLTDSNWVSD